MKKLLLAITLFLIGFNAFAAKFEEKDLSSRLLVMDQAAGSVQGMIVIRNSVPEDKVLGPLVVEVGQLNINGKQLSGKCSAQFDEGEQSLFALCNGNSDVLSLKLSNSNGDIASYLKGSFASAELTFGARPLTENTPRIQVDVKNLNLK